MKSAVDRILALVRGDPMLAFTLLSQTQAATLTGPRLACLGASASGRLLPIAVQQPKVGLAIDFGLALCGDGPAAADPKRLLSRKARSGEGFAE